MECKILDRNDRNLDITAMLTFIKHIVYAIRNLMRIGSITVVVIYKFQNVHTKDKNQ